MIAQEVSGFWEKSSYPHFINTGVKHSQYIQQKLNSLVKELPESSKLTNDEVFILSSAAWLYETGYQSPNLGNVLNFDFVPGKTLSGFQLKAVRDNKHLLTERLIWDSISATYQGPPLQLGLIRPLDDYTQAIIEVCRSCSSELLDNIPEKMPVYGDDVRIRLLAALLRLADQLYIHYERINPDLLICAELPEDQLAYWWIYQYVQVTQIVNGQIPFFYFLPETEKELTGAIRLLIESRFKYDQNPNIRYLWHDHDLRLMPGNDPIVKYFKKGERVNKVKPEIASHLRFCVPTEKKVERVTINNVHGASDSVDYEMYAFSPGETKPRELIEIENQLRFLYREYRNILEQHNLASSKSEREFLKNEIQILDFAIRKEENYLANRQFQK